MEELNIEPVWNVAYHCQFNDAVEVSQISSINHSYCIEILGITERKIPKNSIAENVAHS